jgi:molecular chaperone DnaK
LFGWEAKLRSEESIEAVKRLLRGDERISLAGEEFDAATVVAGFFDALRRRAADRRLSVDRAVVTVPANATCAARFRTRAAARVSGVQVQALVNEPTAAAIAYSYDVGTPGRILVFDWGGGTVDVTILQYDDTYGLFEEQATRGIPELGGLELDERLGQLVLKKLGRKPQWSPAEWAQFTRDVERTKIRLSAEEFAVMTTPDFSRTIEIERAEFEACIGDLVALSSEPLRACLADLRVAPDEIDAILMIGGTSQVPMVRRRIEEILDAPTVSPEVCEPLTAVARGAAIGAAILDKELDMDISVSTTHALGTVSTKDGIATFSEIIPRNATLPRRETKTYTPNNPNKIRIQVWEGDPSQPLESQENFRLGEISVDLPPGRTREANTFKLTYTYDTNGLLHVKAVIAKDGQVLLDREVQQFGARGSGAGVTPESLRGFLTVSDREPR